MSVGSALTVNAGPGNPATVRPPSATLLVLVAVAAAFAGAACLWLLATTPSPADIDPTQWLIQLAANLFTIAVGLVAWHARPGNRVGPLLALVGFTGMIDFLSLSHNGLLWTIGDMWNLLGTVVLAHVYLAFPEGRTRGWSRRLVVAVYGWFFAWSIGIRLIRPYPATWPFQNPFLVWPSDQLVAPMQHVANLGALVLTILVVATVLERWRRGSPVARRALAPVFWVSPITLVVVGTFFTAQLVGSDLLFSLSTGPLAQLSNFLLPIAFLVGLLQTRLERASIADLVRELDGVSIGDLESALARAVHDPSLRLAFATADGSAYLDPTGRPIDLPSGADERDVTRIQAGTTTMAVLVHDPAVDEDLVASAAAASRLALENARLAAELRAQLEEVRASRTRIVDATDDERRRLERDLHDGAQQRLVALGFTLREATRHAAGDAELGRLLDDAARELEDGLRELRVLARGIHPTGLADGLLPAVSELADRSPIPVEVEVDDRRFPTAVESAAYFIVAEALTNVLRHAAANRVRVSGRVEGTALRLEIADDGHGGADGGAGTGLRGMVDRAEAVGGTLSVEDRADGGTLVRARLPIG